MIATIKVLQVHASDPGQVAKAARSVVNYVRGGQPALVDPFARYYGRGHARGRARGLAAGLVGWRGEVSGLTLERVLRGEHAVRGRPLLSAAGSAGRVLRTPTTNAHGWTLYLALPCRAGLPSPLNRERQSMSF